MNLVETYVCGVTEGTVTKNWSEELRMVHFSCDLCKCPIDAKRDLRYVVKMEVYAAMDNTAEDELDDDRDYLLEIQDILQRMEDGQCDQISDDVYHAMRFDLCTECRQRFVKQPLGRESVPRLDFSQN